MDQSAVDGAEIFSSGACWRLASLFGRDRQNIAQPLGITVTALEFTYMRADRQPVWRVSILGGKLDTISNEAANAVRILIQVLPALGSFWKQERQPSPAQKLSR